MRIALNGKVLSNKKPAGPEIYTKNIFEAIQKIDNENEYYLYVDQDIPYKFDNFNIRKLKKSISWTQLTLAKELIENTPDVFFTTVHTMPFFRNPRMRTVCMIHGLEYRFNKGGLIFNILKGKHEWFVSKFSDALIVPSAATKNAILKKRWGISEKKISVVPEGVNGQFFPRSSQGTAPTREKYKLYNDPYLIFVSTIQPRKNLSGLIEGLSLYFKANPDSNLKLLVVGKNGWDYQESLKAPEKFGIKEKVIFTGRVPQEDLPPLLSAAKAFVSTSLEEGFGLPLLEAMSSGIPVIVSNIDAFKEVGADTVWYIEPTKPRDVADSISDLMSGKYQQTLVESALNRSREFTWEKSAEKTIQVFKSVV